MNLFGAESPPPLLAGGIGEDISRSINNMIDDAYVFVEKLIPAIVLLIIGILIAMVFRRAATIVLNKLGLDAVCNRLGVTAILARANIKTPLSEILGKLLFWVLILLFLISATDTLGMPQFSEPLHGLVAFLPNLITAAIIFMAGFIASDVVRGIILKTGERLGLDFAKPLAGLVYVFLLVLTGTICASTLGIDTTLIRHTVEIALLAGALAIALAMGLGMRPLTQNIIAGVYVRDNFKAGTRVRVKDLDIDATVVGVGPVSTRLRSADAGENREDVVLPNHTMISSVVKATPADSGEAAAGSGADA